jgi:phospholipase/carboxylesterase
MPGPHRGQPVLEAGERLGAARAAMILLHGRGASAEDIMTVGAELHRPGFAYLAPQAAGNAWYPHPFTAPIESNEPFLSSALGVVEDLLQRIQATIPAQRVVILGFSQGACLALEFAARNPRRYGGVVGLSGGLIGPDGSPRQPGGGFEGTPVFLGCSDVDPHIPKARVVAAGEVFEAMGAAVTVRLYPGMAHTVSSEELAAVREIVEAV